MSFRAGLVEYLGNEQAIAQLVGARIHPGRLPDKPELPAIVYQVVSDEQRFAHDGAIPLRHPRLQLDVWAHRASETEQVGEALADALVGYRGAMGDVAYTGGWALENATDLYERETGFYRQLLEFRGWYQPEGGTS